MENKTKHTQGEWTSTQTSISDANGVIATTYVNTVKRYIGKQEAEANAKLMAAAPELLDALQTCYNWAMNGNQEGLIVFEQALAAINKATQ